TARDGRGGSARSARIEGDQVEPVGQRPGGDARQLSAEPVHPRHTGPARVDQHGRAVPAVVMQAQQGEFGGVCVGGAVVQRHGGRGALHRQPTDRLGQSAAPLPVRPLIVEPRQLRPGLGAGRGLGGPVPGPVGIGGGRGAAADQQCRRGCRGQRRPCVHARDPDRSADGDIAHAEVDRGAGRWHTAGHVTTTPGDPLSGPRGTKGQIMAEANPYGGAAPTPRRQTRIQHLAQWKAEGRKWAMLTAYDYSTARIFDAAEIPVLLVGDSAANVVFGYDTTLPISDEEMIPLVRAVVRGAPHALVVTDLPFGTYEASPEQALATAVRYCKEGLAHAVKIEGGPEVAPQIAALVAAGIPVMAHIGFTPQSVNGLGGFRVKGRGEAGAEQVEERRAAGREGRAE